MTEKTPRTAAGPSRRPRAPALDRLLVGVDFTPGSIEAAGWAARLAPQADLVLAHVAQVPYPPSFLRRGLPRREEVVKTALAGAEQRLAEVAAALPGEARQIVREGRAPEELAALAQELTTDLVVVGTHRRWGVWSKLGSTAAALLGESPAPVLLAQGAGTLLPRHLLVPMDDSSDARRALAWGAFLARRLEAQLTVLHVVSASLLGHMRRVSSEVAAVELEQRCRAETERWLEEELAATGLPAEQTSTVVETGVPALEILAAAARLGSELVVIGGRGSGAGRLLGLGSVASAVVWQGTGPVLVVPPPGR